MYPPQVTLPAASIQYICLHTFISAMHGQSVISFNWNAIVGTLTVFFFWMFMRISDDLKDRLVDPVLFPERPLPSGRVLESDLWILWGFTIALMIIMNVVFSAGLMLFGVLMVFGLLMFNYFFLRKYIAKNLLLAFITHNPTSFLLALYVVSIPLYAINIKGVAIVRIEVLAVAFWFWGFGMVWEISRKLRAPGYETAYDTYSKIFGFRLAAVIPLFVVLLQLAIVLANAGSLKLHNPGMILMSVATLAVVGFYVRFMVCPSPASSKLKPVAETHMVIQTLILSVDLLYSRSILWL